MDKIVCVHHSVDLDGWTSGAIVKEWAEENNYNIDFIGYNYEKELPDVSEYNTVIMVDCSFPIEEMIKLYNRLGDDFILIDHHTSIIKDIEESGIKFNGKQVSGISASELAWDFFFPDDPIPIFVHYIGMWDTFRHKGTIDEVRFNQFQYGARYYVDCVEVAQTYLTDNEDDYYDILDTGAILYANLLNEAKQAYKQHFVINYQGKKFATINKDRLNPGSLGIDYHKDGYDGFMSFVFDGKEWKFSIYSENDETNCAEIAKSFGGGGHVRAAGFRLPFDKLKELLNNGWFKSI